MDYVNDTESALILQLQENEKAKTQRRILTLGEALKEDSMPLEYVFYPWLLRQGIVIIFAERGVGKSYFSFYSAHAMARGGDFLKWYAAKPYRVLYVDGEMQFPLLKERLLGMEKMYGDKANDNFFLLTPDKYGQVVPDVATKEGQDIVETHVRDHNIDVLFLDNIATLMPSLKKNSNDEWQSLVQPWLLKIRSKGLSIVMVDHSGKFNKDSPQKSRGCTAKEDTADTAIKLTRPVGYEPENGARFNIDFDKARHFYGLDAKSFEAWLKPDENGVPYWYCNEVKLPTVEHVISLHMAGKMQKEIVDIVGVSQQRVSNILKEARNKGKI